MIGDQLMGAQLQSTASGNQMNKAIETGVGALGQAGAAYVKAKPLYEKKETVMGPDPIRESEYYQFKPQLAPEGVEIPKEDKTKIFTTSQVNTNISGDMYSGLGLKKEDLFQL
jgi:hypothetical protein